MIRICSIFLFLLGHTSGFTVWFNNIKTADSTAVPILDNTGKSIDGGLGYAAAGTFSTPPNQFANFGDFQPFGEGSTSFNGVASGFFDLNRSAPIPEGTTSAPVGERIYVVIGDGNTLSTSMNFAVFDSGLTFGTENILGLGATDINITSDVLRPDSLIVGDLLADVDTGLGLTFERAIRLAAVQEPVPPVLNLESFYESAPNQPLEIDASNSSNQISGTTYQWYFNGFQIPANFGGNSPKVEFNGLTSSEGSWRVTATNFLGEETATFRYRVFVDTDLDGLSDYREQNLAGTNFEMADTDGDGLNDKLEYEGVTNPNLADSDEDGLSDGVEINQTQTDPTIADTDQDGIVDGLDDQDGDGLSNKDEIGIYGTSPLLADTDGDSIDDKTELEILSDPNTATTTEELITIIRGMATIQSTDSDGDGLTDVKEAELESDSGTATTFYLGDVYDDAVESALVRGRGEVTSTPQNFNLISTAAYAALQVECDSRFLDTDSDGLTDQKEKELESDSLIETTFYLTDAYDEAVNSALISGRSEVTSNPQNFDLISTVAYNALQLQRDADLADYSKTLAQKDGVIGTLNNSITAKDAAYAVVVAERDARPTLSAYESAVVKARKDGADYVISNLTAFSLTTREAYDEVIAERDARPTIEEVKDARLGSVVLQPDGANQSIKIRFSIEETDDFRTWVKRDGINEVTVPLEAGSKFYRFALQDT